MKILERDVKYACMDFLEKSGAFCWNNPTGCTRVGADRWVHFGKVGSSDIIGILPDGRFIAVETKASKGGRLSDTQKSFLEKVRQHGGVAIVARSTADIEAELVRQGYVSPVLTF
jgi:hypothetical protein